MKQARTSKVHSAQMDVVLVEVVKKCCASCAHKTLTRAVLLRRCKARRVEVRPSDYCTGWQLSKQLKAVGQSAGLVKRREYLMYLAAVREEEELAVQSGRKVKEKSIAQVRMDFEREHGSIYLF